METQYKAEKQRLDDKIKMIEVDYDKANYTIQNLRDKLYN